MSDSRRLRVMCVDDNPLMTASLQRRIEQESFLEWAGSSNGAGSLVEDIQSSRADVLLLDVDMPGLDTFALVETLARVAPSVRVAMLSGHTEPSYVTRAIDAGAWGYLSKHDEVAALIASIRSIGCGELVLSADVKSR
jgi:DNA-binding NarL/FixJ family response regulator